MTAPVLAETLGPRARRRVLVASVAAMVVIVLLLVAAVRRLDENGQLDARKWRPLTEAAVLRFYWNGFAATLKAAGVAMVLATAVGTFVALARLAQKWPLRWVAAAYVEFFRGLPLFVLMLFCGLGLPRYVDGLSAFSGVVIALTIYNSAVLAEIFRAGMLSLDRGQTEAAYAIGMGYWQAMATVVIPQAVRRMAPAIVSQLVTLLKDTSLGYAIAFEEILRRSRITGGTYGNNLHAFILAAVFYIAVNASLGAVARRLELRQRRRYGAGRIDVGGIEDLATVAAQGEAQAAGRTAK